MKTRLPLARHALGRTGHYVPGAATAAAQQVRHILHAPRPQAKLAVGAPDDAFEREADQVADRVMRMPAPGVQRKCHECETELRAKEEPERMPSAPPGFESRFATLQGSGRPLPASERAFFEPRFGRDFSNVRVHSGPAAGELARAVHARAFTLGDSIVFGGSQYAPGTSAGRQLLAHELMHPVQQGGGAVLARVQRVEGDLAKGGSQPQAANDEPPVASMSVGLAGVVFTPAADATYHRRPQVPQNLGVSADASRGRSSTPPISPVLFVGNQAVGRFLQAKLRINEPGDVFEQEADRVADQVMRSPSGIFDGSNGAPPDIQRKCACGSGQPSGECVDCREEHEGPLLRAAAGAAGVQEALSIVDDVIGSQGEPLESSTRAFFESRFGRQFEHVRVHADPRAAHSADVVKALAYTVGRDVVFARTQFSPDSTTGRRLLAHELAHVVQQGAAPPLALHDTSSGTRGGPAVVQGAAPHLARQATTIDIEVVSSLDQYQPPGTQERYRVGDAAASRLLMDIQERGGRVTFFVFNFETGTSAQMSPNDWSFFHGAAIIGGSNAGITRLGRQLSPAKWRSLWPNPMPELLRMFEAGQVTLDDEAVLTGYHGMIRVDAAASLAENQRAIDQLLGSADRVQRIQEFATGLREASVVRDTLDQRRDELSRRLVAQHSFTFGLPHAGTGPNVVQQLNIQRERGEVEDTLAFWLSAFPLLTRLQTDQISAASVDATLREIRANIVSTREELTRGRLDPMTLDAARGRLAGRLGPRATAVVAAEDKSRSRWAMVGAVATLAASIGILFLPGGIFIDAAIGVAIAGHAVANAVELGRAANTGLHVDDGLVSQSQAQWARFGAALAVVFAVIGTAAAGFRVLRVGLALRGLSRSMPELALAERAAVARAIANDPALLSAFTRMGAGDLAISARVAGAVRQAAGDVRALRAALGDVARIAAIPRRIPTNADAYEPLRRITDGSDVAKIARQTGLPHAVVDAAKRNLMLDEHILVDNAGRLYRGRFEPFEDVARLWGRAARGQSLAEADRAFLRRLITHEHAEGAILGSSAQSLERAFLRGELEGSLRTFLQSSGWKQSKIDAMLALESKPITPYRYAHIVSAIGGAPNP